MKVYAYMNIKFDKLPYCTVCMNSLRNDPTKHTDPHHSDADPDPHNQHVQDPCRIAEN